MTAILVFVSETYIPIARNWLDAVGRLGHVDRVSLVALDEATRFAFLDAGVQVLNAPLDSPEPGEIWLHRSRIIVEMLREGVDVVHSDADAVWIHDPLRDLVGSGNEMVFSQGTIHPPESLKQRGFVLCAGLFGIRPTRQTIAFWDQLLPRIAVDGDDQRALNRLVDERFPEWSIRAPYTLTHKGKSFITSRDPMTATADGLTISILPHHRYPRLVANLDEAIVAHPLSGKTATATKSALRHFNLWSIDEEAA